MRTKHSIWGTWESIAAEKRNCRLYFILLSANDKQKAVEDKKTTTTDDIQRETREETAAGEKGKELETCKRQEKQARFGYTPSG